MSWFRELFVRDHVFAVWSDAHDRQGLGDSSRVAGSELDGDGRPISPSLRPTVFSTTPPGGRTVIPAESFACDSWPPDDVIIRARGRIEQEGRDRPTRPPFRQAAPAVFVLMVAAAALAAVRGDVPSAEASLAAVAPVVERSESAARHRWTYDGPEHLVVRRLLASVDGWRVPACDSCATMATPRVAVDPACPRDGAVASAVQYAWAAEAYAVVGRDEQAIRAASAMREQLVTAEAICRIPTPAAGAGVCGGSRLWPCPV